MLIFRERLTESAAKFGIGTQQTVSCRHSIAECSAAYDIHNYLTWKPSTDPELTAAVQLTIHDNTDAMGPCLSTSLPEKSQHPRANGTHGFRDMYHARALSHDSSSLKAALCAQAPILPTITHAVNPPPLIILAALHSSKPLEMLW